ncbi:OTU domain-containing protein [Hibiscus syriacus]|uniref:Ubiquitin thioesterase OTU n=1 Tax=Hibiscus syriacus TaxID=106335 RepID=A0A6A3BRW7_HIBSY|nr:OTU domain-containing protein [Hibiscus syriacus]
MTLRNEVDELKRKLLICNGAMSEWDALKTFLEGLRQGRYSRESKEMHIDFQRPYQGMPSGKNDKAKSGAKKKMSKEKLKCYFCDGPHLIRGCPEKRRLTTIMKMMREGEGINATKQGSRRGKAVDVEAVEPRRKRDETAGVKAVEHKKGPDAITRDKAVKLRVQSEQVCSQYVRMEAWSKLRCLRHKGTLKEYVSRFRKLMLKVPSLTKEDGFFTFMIGLKPWAKRLLEQREVKELSKALKTAESIKEYGVKKNKTSKTKPKAEGSGKRIHDEGKSKDEECCSSSGRESQLNNEPDGEYGEDVCSLGTSSSVKDAKPRVRVEQMMGRKLNMPEVLQNYPRGAESSKVMDEPMIELSREEDEPRIEEVLRVGSIRFVSAKASRSQVQEELSVSKEFAEHVLVEYMASETILRERSKQGLAEDFQVKNNPSKTSRKESKKAKTLRDKATTEKLPNNKWFYRAVTTDKLKLCIPDDGRCLFRSVIHGAWLRSEKRSPSERSQKALVDELRAKVADEFIKRRVDTEWFVEGDFDKYVVRMRQPHIWGGEPELLMCSRPPYQFT